MATVEEPPVIGYGRMRRKEDPPLITGQGNYTDDITLPGMLYAAFVRSPEARARITSTGAS